MPPSSSSPPRRHHPSHHRHQGCTTAGAFGRGSSQWGVCLCGLTPQDGALGFESAPQPRLFRELLPFVKLYSGNIVSRNVLIPGIPSPFVIVLKLWSLLLGPGAVPAGTTLSNRSVCDRGLELLGGRSFKEVKWDCWDRGWWGYCESKGGVYDGVGETEGGVDVKGCEVFVGTGLEDGCLLGLEEPNTGKQEKKRQTCGDYRKYEESYVRIKCGSISKKKKSNYSSFQDLRSSCNEDMVKYEGPRPGTTQARALNEKI
ncbi:hypothetical protein Tco_0528740 [Tanacetum coccineum]